MQPAYIKLHKDGELNRRVEAALERLESCDLCPRMCGVNRLAGETGTCGTGRRARVASYNAHFGEEAPLVGRNGSGTIFLSSCSLLCGFCQNYEISHQAEGVEVEPEDMAAMMLHLASRGCHNINFVTPTHVIPQILEAIQAAVDQGLNVPFVYNSSGYDRVETLRLLDGIFDIYMPDYKFFEERWAERYCNAPDYPKAASASIKEMHRQAGDLVVDDDGVARRGLLVRHLVMPNGVAGTGGVMKFLAGEISIETYVNVMDQYRPCGIADRDEFIDRRLTAGEYREAVDAATAAGLTRLDSRDRPRLLFAF
ncbi:MAG: radical SAM protein [Deltaproteobacteria bacterium]|nr:radical SAM protein [Deltaproteobacteria bacterium]